MAKIEGRVNENRQALVGLDFLDKKITSLDCEVDTGFAGTLMIPRDWVTQNNLPIVGQETYLAVENTEFTAETTSVLIRWLGKDLDVPAIISEHGHALIGNELFSDAVLTIDYPNKTVIIEK